MVRLRSPQVAEYVNGAAVGSPTREYVHSGSALLATIEGGVTTYHQDHLSVRVNTNASGTKIGEQGHFPFGESWYASSTTTKWQFTSYERDSESVLDYAIFRYDNSRLGRFMTPDPIAGSLADPQSLNRYAYVRNDPVNLSDPLGLIYTDWWGWDSGGGGCWDAWCGGGWSWGGGCTVDGVPTSCSFAFHLVETGAGTPCPGNDCRRTYYDHNGVHQLQSAAVRIPDHMGRACDENGANCGPPYALTWRTVYLLQWMQVGTTSRPYWANAGDFEEFIHAFEKLMRPLYFTAASAGLINIGAAQIVLAGVVTYIACAETGGLGCAVVAIHAPGLAAGGLFLIKYGVDFTREHTIPAWLELFNSTSDPSAGVPEEK